MQIRAGLPSAVEEDLQKNIDIAVYVPDRKPFVRFSGKTYVLPSRGQQGIPLVSVNTAKVEVEVYRIGDRNLVGALESGDFQRQLSGYELEQIKSRTGEKVFTGSMDVPQKLNEEVTTALPVTDAVGALKPGVYVMIAKPTQKSREEYNAEATQWFIVSDLGLTAFSGDDGVHAFVRSLADATPSADVNVKLIARNNEVLGTAKTDASGYAKFDAGPGARRRRPAAGAARRRERQRRIRLPRSHLGRLRSDRPRRQGPRDARARSTASSIPSAASIAPARTCTSPPSCATPPARPRACPSRSSSRAPTASSTAAITLKDQGLGGREHHPAARRVGA